MAKKHIRTIICTECGSRRKELTMFLEMEDRVIKCPDCGFEGKVVGHYANQTVFCNECYDFGCNAAHCDCDCHVELDEKMMDHDRD